MFIFFLVVCFVVSELQEEGMNAINLPLSPTPYELHPEDTMLGTSPYSVSQVIHLNTSVFYSWVFMAKINNKYYTSMFLL